MTDAANLVFMVGCFVLATVGVMGFARLAERVRRLERLVSDVSDDWWKPEDYGEGSG